MKKPGKTIELTTSAQISAWRQRLDVSGAKDDLMLLHRVSKRSASTKTTRKSRRWLTYSTQRTPTCTTSRMKMLNRKKSKMRRQGHM